MKFIRNTLSLTTLLSLTFSLSASTLSLNDLLQQNNWTVVDSNNQPVSQSSLEAAHSACFKAKFGINNLNTSDKPTYTKIVNSNKSVNDVVSACLGKKTTVLNGDKLVKRTDLTEEQREKIFQAAVHLFRLGVYENKWDEFYVGPSIHDDAVYVTNANAVQVGKAAISNGVSKQTKLLTVDNSLASQAEIDAFMLTDKKSQLSFEPLSISIDENVVTISVSNILNTAKKKAADFERRFQNTTVFYWDFDENDQPSCFLIVDTVDLAASGTRIATWLLEDTLEGGNAASRAGSGFLSGLFTEVENE